MPHRVGGKVLRKPNRVMGGRPTEVPGAPFATGYGETSTGRHPSWNHVDVAEIRSAHRRRAVQLRRVRSAVRLSPLPGEQSFVHRQVLVHHAIRTESTLPR